MTKVGVPMPPADSAACERCQRRLAAIMMEVQRETGGAAVPMSALVNVLAYGMAHLFDSSDAAMAHLQKILPAEIDRHLAGGTRLDAFVTSGEVGHA